LIYNTPLDYHNCPRCIRVVQFLRRKALNIEIKFPYLTILCLIACDRHENVTPSIPVITIYTPQTLRLRNSTFCPHIVFMCFVWISEQTVIISPNSINLLVFITETECVYCTVRAEYLNIILLISIYITPIPTSVNDARSSQATAQ